LSDGVSSVENSALVVRKDPKVGVFLVSKYQIVLAALRYLLPSSPDIEIVGEAEGTLQIASDAIQKQKPNVVLLDMPEAGNSAIRLVTEIKNVAGSAIVILGVDDSPRLVRAILMSGVKGYVLKRSSNDELTNALRSAACNRNFLDSRLIHAIALSRREPSVKPRDEALSPRQLQVFKGLVEGYTNLDLARDLHLSVKTVETYRARIYEKLQLHNRADLVRYAVRTGAISVAS